MRRGSLILAGAVIAIAVAVGVFSRRGPQPSPEATPASISPKAGLDVVPTRKPRGKTGSVLPTAPAPASARPLVPMAGAPEQPPERKETPSPTPIGLPTPQARTELEKVHSILRNFQERFGGNPVGTNAEITAALAGKNPKQVNFLANEEVPRNGAGEWLDDLGTPYFFHQLARDHMEIRSAGPDRTMWTADDVILP